MQPKIKPNSGELGLTKSQMLGLERQLAQTGRQLRDAEKRAERAFQESRLQRASAGGMAGRAGGGGGGDDAFGVWDD